MEGKEKGNGVSNTALGLAIGSLTWQGLQNGLLGGALGGNRPPMEPPATQRDVNYERQLTEKDMEIAQLKAEKYTDQAVLAAERRFADKLENVNIRINEMDKAQSVLNARQTDALVYAQTEINKLDAVFAPYIKGPIMTASEAVATKFETTPAAATAGN